MGLAARDNDLQNVWYKAFFQSKSVVHRRSPHFEISKFMIPILCFFKHYNFMNFAQKLDDENSLSRGTFSCSIQAVIKKNIFELKMTICGDLAI